MYQKKIRTLRPGEKVPTGKPTRWVNEGYVNLRWRIAVGEFVETLEHRVVDGYVTTAPEVHHVNRHKADNRSENLEYVTGAEHKHLHREIPDAEIVEMYNQGMSLREISEATGWHRAALGRAIRRSGLKVRDYVGWNRIDLDEKRLVELLADPTISYPAIGEILGTSGNVIAKRARALGVRRTAGAKPQI
jgi:hypothetical protein